MKYPTEKKKKKEKINAKIIDLTREIEHFFRFAARVSKIVTSGSRPTNSFFFPLGARRFVSKRGF